MLNSGRALNWMPLDHVGGVVMFHLRDVFTAGTQIHAPTHMVLGQPLKWLDWIDRYRATITWAPNFAYGLVNGQADAIREGRWDLSSMRFILNAGEAIVAKTTRRFMQLLAPHGLSATSMYPAWGMSETCSAVTFSHDFSRATTGDEDTFVSVGRPVPGVALRIADAAKHGSGAARFRRLAINVAARLHLGGCTHPLEAFAHVVLERLSPVLVGHERDGRDAAE